MSAPPAVDEIVATLWGPGVNSHTRVEPLLRLTSWQPPEVFWRVFNLVFATCDATWPWRSELLDHLRARHQEMAGSTFLDGEARAFFDGLPDLVAVHRGCSRPRVRGVSWSTDPEVAAGFAAGHRGIRVPDPVIASAVIPKTHVFTVFVERRESEVILDPRRLRALAWEPAP
jgi:hypothetical protein